MKSVLLHPMYFGSIAQYVAIAQAEKVCFENEDNFQKQTYRNRTYIYGANGKLLLTVPVKHSTKQGRKRYTDIRIENEFQWQSLHWKSLESAYRTSPFFEYYEDELAPLFEKKKTFLLDFNYECMEVIFDCLQVDTPYTKTDTYQKTSSVHTDLRSLINVKTKPPELSSYIQVFTAKYGFLPNLSILDLLCNEGTNALLYLEQQPVL